MDNNESERESDFSIDNTYQGYYTTSEENKVWDLISFGCGHSDGASVNGMHFCSELA